METKTIKKGTARLALLANQEGSNLRIQPTNLNYSFYKIEKNSFEFQ
jgi:hypothetical protein